MVFCFSASPAGAGLTESARLSAIYDTILQARFDETARQLAQACPPAPIEACKALSVVSLWWQIVLDPYNRSLDRRFEQAARDAISATSAWTRREPARAESWFYEAGAYGPYVQWRVLRGQRLSAARDATKIKSALERALSLDPGLADAYFGIGLYHYYADVVPTSAKILRALLLMPGGDRAQGLSEMLRARDQGQLLRGEADFQLHWLYLWYEHEPTPALELVRALDARYASNPQFLQRIAEIQHEYFHDHQASATAWRSLIDRARAGRVNATRMAEVRARIGLAAELNDLSQPSEALDQLKMLIAMRPNEPYSSQALAQFELGRAYERLGERDRASAAYTAVLSLAPDDDALRMRPRARAALGEIARKNNAK
jgi:tetratricopeptide (TPR) repeat protein